MLICWTPRQAVDEYFIVTSEDPQLLEPNMLPLRQALLEKSLRYYQRFVEQNRDDQSLKLDVALSKLRIGRILASIGTRQEALEAFESATSELSDYVQANPGNVSARFNLARAMTNMATLQRWATGDVEAALKVQLDAIDIQQSVYKEAPTEEHARNLAKMFNQASLLYRSLQRFDKQLNALVTAGELHNSANQNSEPNLNDVLAQCKSSMNLANYFHARSDWEKAVPIYKSLVAQLEEQIAKSPRLTAANLLLSQNYMHLAQCAQKQDQFSEAIEYYAKAGPLIERIAIDYPSVSRYQLELRLNLQSQAFLNLQLDSLELAIEQYRKCTQILKSLLNVEPDVVDYRIDLCKDLNGIAECQLELGEIGEALATYEESIGQSRIVLGKQPQSLKNRFERARSFYGLAKAYAKQADSRQASSSVEQAINLLEHMKVEMPNNQQFEQMLNDAKRIRGSLKIQN